MLSNRIRPDGLFGAPIHRRALAARSALISLILGSIRSHRSMLTRIGLGGSGDENGSMPSPLATRAGALSLQVPARMVSDLTPW